MKKISKENLLSLIVSYFAMLGFGSEAATFFTPSTFASALVLDLPGVCLVTKNKPKTTSGNQSHIHVTGPSRGFFFPLDKIETLSGADAERMQAVVLSKVNIANLNKMDMSPFRDLSLTDSETLVKVGRTSSIGGRQVQISKIRSDGKDFLNLRNGLYIHDLLVFLKYSDSDKMFALGLPKSFYEELYSSETGVFSPLKGSSFKTLKSALEIAAEVADSGTSIHDDELLSDNLYQQLVDEVDDSSVEDYITEYEDAQPFTGSTEAKSSSHRPSADANKGKAVIKHNGYCCIFSPDHETFTKEDGTKYMEVHHIIPLSKQRNFTNKLDTRANLVPVCPLCHRKLHHGKKADVDVMLDILFKDRCVALSASGLSITLDELKSYY